MRTEAYSGTLVSDRDLVDGAIRGMIGIFHDPHTEYFSPAEAIDFQQHLAGSFEGIGAELGMTGTGILTVIKALPNSPAERAGLQHGDQITSIDGWDITTATTLTGAVDRIHGQDGTTVHLMIIRSGVTQEIDVVRGQVAVQYATYTRLDNGDNLIQINTFGDNVADQFADALAQAYANTDSNKIIIDLRDDGGGELDQVSTMLGNFVPAGQPTAHIEYPGSSTDILSTGNISPQFASKNIIVLINGNSASASEIMTLGIRDYLPDAKIIGETSYGKGTVQTYHEYPDQSAVKYTIAKWVSGRTHQSINGIGIVPDIEVKFDPDAAKKGVDNQLEFAKDYKF